MAKGVCLDDTFSHYSCKEQGFELNDPLWVASNSRYSMICGIGFSVFSAPLGIKGTPPPPPPHTLCTMVTSANLLSTVHEEPRYSPNISTFFIYNNVHPVLLISLLFFTYLTATTLSTSFPVSCKELLPKQSPLTSADFKRQK